MLRASLLSTIHCVCAVKIAGNALRVVLRVGQHDDRELRRRRRCRSATRDVSDPPAGSLTTAASVGDVANAGRAVGRRDQHRRVRRAGVDGQLEVGRRPALLARRVGDLHVPGVGLPERQRRR